MALALNNLKRVDMPLNKETKPNQTVYFPSFNLTTFFLLPSSYHIYPTPPVGQDMTQGQFFKRSLTGLNSEFSFSKTSCLTKAEEPSLPYYLPIARGRIIGSIPFPRVLVLCETQSVSSRIWTRVAVSISYDDNHYTTGTSPLLPLSQKLNAT